MQEKYKRFGENIGTSVAYEILRRETSQDRRYDFYKYELVDGKYIGFCRFIEKSYSIINENFV